MSLSKDNSTPTVDGYGVSINPWDFVVTRDDTQFSKTADIVIYFITFVALLLYLPTCYVIRRHEKFWKQSAFRLMLAQDIYEILNLIFRVIPLFINFSTNKVLHKFGCFLPDILDSLRYMSLYAHLMIAGNRFVAGVLYKHYKTLFTPRFTALYILLFFSLPVIQRGSFAIAGLRICATTRFGLSCTSPSQQIMDAYMNVDMAVTASIVVLLIISYTIIIYKLRQVIKKRKANIIAPKLVVPSREVKDVEMKEQKPQDIATTSGNQDIATTTGNQDIATTTGNQDIATTTGNQDIATTTGNQDIATTSGKQVIATTSTSKHGMPIISGKVSMKLKGSHKTSLDVQEIKLTFHFIMATTVYITTYIFALLPLFVVVPHVMDMYLMLSAVNFSVNAVSILLISTEIRTAVIKLIKHTSKLSDREKCHIQC